MQPPAALGAARAPTARSIGWIDGALVFGLSFAYLRLLPDCFSLFDEGIFAHTAERVAHGEILYRDVFSYWTPGGFWLGAALFHIAGVSVNTLRISLALLGAGAAVVVWRIARDHTGRVLAVIAALAAPLVCYPIWWMASSHWYSTFSALAAALTLHAAVGRHRSSAALFATGLLCGVTFVILQPVGVLVSAAVAVAVVWDRFWTASLQQALTSVALFALGTIIFPGAMCFYLVLHDALPAMVYDTLVWNLESYHPAIRASYGSLPLGMPRDVSVRASRLVLGLLPPLAYATGLALSAMRYVRRAPRPQDRQLFAIACVGTGLLAGNYYYPDFVHLAFAAPPAFVVAAALMSRIPAGRRGWKGAGALLLLVFVLFAGGSFAYRERARCCSQVVTQRGTVAVHPEDATDLQEVFAYLAQQLPPDEPLFVYPYAPGYYFLAARPNPTRYGYVVPFLPGVTTQVQLAEIASTLERRQVRYVVLSLLWGRGMLARYDTVLERYIRDHYHILRAFPKSTVLERDAPGRSGAKIRRAL